MTSPGSPTRDGAAPWTQSQGSPKIGPPGGMLRTLSVQPWDVNPIPTAINFFRREQANMLLGPNAGDTVVSTLLGNGALQAPAQNVVSIQAVSLFCDAPTATTSISYTVRANKSAIPGLQNLGFPPQTAGFINFPIPGPFNVVVPAAYIDVVVTRIVTDVAALVNLTFLGWFNTPQDAQRWTGQVPGQIG